MRWTTDPLASDPLAFRPTSLGPRFSSSRIPTCSAEALLCIGVGQPLARAAARGLKPP